MRSFWSDPYLWVHLAGIAAFPIFLEICFLGLAVGDPVLPVPVELFLVGAIGIAPILWMQWQRPFSIFSLVAFAVKPSHLSEDQRRLLTLFKTVGNQILATVVAVVMMLLLWQLYRVAPIASGLAPFPPEARLLGLGLAALALLASHLFLQVPLSVTKVLLTSDAKFAATQPYPTEKINRDFTLFGLQIKQILPAMTSDVPQAVSPVKPPVAPVVSPEVESLSELAQEANQPVIEPIAPPVAQLTNIEEQSQPVMEPIVSDVEPVSEIEDQSSIEPIVPLVEQVTGTEDQPSIEPVMLDVEQLTETEEEVLPSREPIAPETEALTQEINPEMPEEPAIVAIEPALEGVSVEPEATEVNPPTETVTPEPESAPQTESPSDSAVGS